MRKLIDILSSKRYMRVLVTLAVRGPMTGYDMLRGYGTQSYRLKLPPSFVYEALSDMERLGYVRVTEDTGVRARRYRSLTRLGLTTALTNPVAVLLYEEEFGGGQEYFDTAVKANEHLVDSTFIKVLKMMFDMVWAVTHPLEYTEVVGQ